MPVQTALPSTGGGALRMIRAASVVAVTGIALWLTSAHSYLLFHSIAEIISIAIAISVFLISWSSRGFSETQPFVLLGIGYLFVAILDILHTLTYQGMNVLPPGQDYATKLWIAARGLQALVTFVFVLLTRLRRTAPSSIAFLAFGSAAALAVLSILVWNVFPLCFVEGQGVTTFKKVSEYVISGLLAGSIVLVFGSPGSISRQERLLLAAAFAANIASELAFTLYISAQGYQNMIGHLLRLGSVALSYRALFSTKVHSRLSLIEELKHSTARLERSEAELRKANLSKDKFFSIIAHDLRNPISGILSLSELLATRFDQLEQKRIREMCALLYDGAQQSSELLECILQWARAQTGRLEVRPTCIPLYELCDGIESLHGPAARGKSISLLSRVPPDAVAFADENMIATVVRNLLSNAIKFTPQGGSVVVASATEGPWERITVTDTGRGMSVAEMQKLFRIDVHFSSPGTDAERGTGMGLILSKELVELNRGRIEVQSSPGKGSTFIVSLPRPPAERPAG